MKNVTENIKSGILSGSLIRYVCVKCKATLKSRKLVCPKCHAINTIIRLKIVKN